MNVHLVSLGCARNLVDSEIMLGHLSKGGFSIIDDPEQAEVIIINTCGFIQDAVEEAIDTILEHSLLKKTGQLKFLVVAGCLPERFQDDIHTSLPEVDLFLGTGAYDRIEPELNRLLQEQSLENKGLFPPPDTMDLQQAETPRLVSTPYIAYVKIAEGCSSRCTYCIIPKLRGRHRSRPVKDIKKEAEGLILSGKKEIILIAQESTYYGNDFTPKQGLDALIHQLAELSQDVRFRILYGHPESIDDATIDAISQYDNFCSYFDLPIQHASTGVLKRMGRKYDKHRLFEVFDNIRLKIKDAALRTTIITGFPGETEKDFQELVDFIEEVRFDHVGVFKYSDSEDLPSHLLPKHVPEDVAEARHDHLMERQAEISLSINQQHVNKTYKVLVEEQVEEDVFLGRTFFQAPEVDGVTFIYSQNAEVGEYASVRISEAYEYDIAGDIQ